MPPVTVLLPPTTLDVALPSHPLHGNYAERTPRDALPTTVRPAPGLPTYTTAGSIPVHVPIHTLRYRITSTLRYEFRHQLPICVP